MNIEDTGSAFQFDDGNQTYSMPYGTLSVEIFNSEIRFQNRQTITNIVVDSYANLTLVGFSGVTDADSLAQYIMEK